MSKTPSGNERRAKIEGECQRQLATYVDNLSSSNDSDDMVMDTLSSPLPSISSPMAPDPPSISPPMASGPPSISPPMAPGPPPVILNEQQLEMEENPFEQMLMKKKLIEEKKTEMERKKKELEEEMERKKKELEEEIEKLRADEYQIDKLLQDFSSKKCFLSLQINGKLSDDIVIRLYHNRAPATSNYFRSLCVGERGYGYEDTVLNYLCVDHFIEGGVKEVFTRSGEKFFDSIKKETDERIPHDKAGLVSMAISEKTTKFMITLNPMNQLDSTHIAFGEIVEGMELLQCINAKGIVRAGGVDHSDVDCLISGSPIDQIRIYTCGEKK